MKTSVGLAQMGEHNQWCHDGCLTRSVSQQRHPPVLAYIEVHKALNLVVMGLSPMVTMFMMDVWVDMSPRGEIQYRLAHMEGAWLLTFVGKHVPSDGKRRGRS